MPNPRTHVMTGSPWEGVVGYARAIRFGDWVLVSGTTAGASIAQVVRTRIYVTDISKWREVGAEHGKMFGEVKPTTTMVEVSALVDPSLLVEVEAEAYTA